MLIHTLELSSLYSTAAPSTDLKTKSRIATGDIQT